MTQPLHEASNGHSADVRIHLVIGHQQLPLAEICPTSCFLRDALDLPPSEAEIVLSVDGHEQRWRVFLDQGISKDSLLVPFRDLNPQQDGTAASEQPGMEEIL